MVDDLRLFTAAAGEIFPARESHLRRTGAARRDLWRPAAAVEAAGRARAAEAGRDQHPSLLQPVPDREALARPNAHRLHAGDEVESGELARWLVESGFHNTPAVELPGEFSVRGGIIDIFAPDWFNPVRVEFFGDRIESLRRVRGLQPAEPGAGWTPSI